MENKFFESILNEAETTKYMACCYDPEGYYEETNYIDEDGELSCNSSGAKLFDTEDEAVEYADDNRPYCWVSFAMPFSTTLNEADDTYKAKVNGKWLKGNKLVKDKKDADTFESKTEPTQRINQMKKDGKINKNAKSSVIKESLTFDDTIRTRIHIESEEDLEDTPFTYYLDADIGDTVYICEDADVYMREDKNGWVIFWHNKFMEHIPLSLLDRDDEEACNAKYRQAQNRYKAICNAALDGTLEKEFLPKNGKPSFDHSNAAEVFKQFGENKINKNQLFESLLQVER